MNLLVRTCAIGLLGLGAAAANAGIILPTNGTSVRFDGGTMVFSTSVLPSPSSTTGVALPTTPIALSAFGDVNHIVNNDSSSPGTGDIGSVPSTDQLTFALTNAFLQPTAVIPAGSGATFEKFYIESNVVGAVAGTGPTLTLWDKTLTPTNGLNTQSFIGTPVGAVPAAVSSGASQFLQFANMPGVTATIAVEFNRANAASPFTTETIVLQSFSDGGFPVTGGSADVTFSMGQSITGNQVPASLTAAIGSTPDYVEGNYALVVTRSIPEPASLAMLAVGGLLIGFRGRNRRTEV
jgi:hypothetical protein